MPAGQALAIDRQPFSASITQQLSNHPNIALLREEVEDLGKLLEHYAAVLVATGPLTSDALSESLQQLIGIGHLSFYDAIAPVVTAESINSQVAFRASRYDKERLIISTVRSLSSNMKILWQPFWQRTRCRCTSLRMCDPSKAAYLSK